MSLAARQRGPNSLPCSSPSLRPRLSSCFAARSFTDVGNTCFGTKPLRDLSMHLDNKGKPYLVFVETDPTCAGQVTVMKLNGANWTVSASHAAGVAQGALRAGTPREFSAGCQLNRLQYNPVLCRWWARAVSLRSRAQSPPLPTPRWPSMRTM